MERSRDFLEARGILLRVIHYQTECMKKNRNVVVLHQNLGWLGLNRHYSIYALFPYAVFPSIMWLAKDDLLM